ncbi:coiled-coil domain-containing protein 80 [Nerophis lumbriciformis]|uniref:coiled-coil domain-containing protein 80 n=1 Tax=Nerophis lumbriciformis TaxID=546530 RepID=UPI002ADFD43D|nr:coiled-coil domain-containing protein 80-like [Nerophis lumbriciformis]
MFCSFHSPWLLLALWSLCRPSWQITWPGSKTKSQLDPNVKDWGDYSDLPTGTELGLGLDEDRRHGDKTEDLGLAPELDFLSDFAGKKRLWVITAPSHQDHYLRMMEKQLEDMDQKFLNCRLAERDTLLVTIVQNAMMEGRIQKTSAQGDATVETLDPDTVTRLLHYLQLTQDQAFNMLVLKKNLRVSERFPYPVRVAAILEVIDQLPARKLEKITRRGSRISCGGGRRKKVRVTRRRMKKRITPRPSHASSMVASQRRKAALRSKIQDILSGRSRFVIRKAPSTGRKSGGGKQEVARERAHVSAGKHEEKNQRPDTSLAEGSNKWAEEKVKEEERNNKEETNNKEENSNKEEKNNKEEKKGKGKKGKKGRKRKGNKSKQEVSEKDKTALKDFLATFKGKRRLMLISTPTTDTSLYVQQRAENQQHHCQLALRQVTVATMVGEGVLTLQQHQLDSEPPFSEVASERWSDPRLISLLRTELGLSSSDLFSMTITDYDIKPNRVFEAPPTSLAMFQHIDHFPSRRPEEERERKDPPSCGRDEQRAEEEDILLRFMSRRRLLLVSAPAEDDYSLQQQLSALHGQECHLGVRHFALLKLTGAADKASGTVELFPLNGRSQSQVEPLGRQAVNNLREQLKVSRDYFSMLVVGKDGDVKAWFPSPMWTLDSVYDLVDSTESRLHEETLQRRLGIHCSEERYHGYDEDGAYQQS